MTGPSKLVSEQHGFYATDATLLQYGGVCHFVLPFDIKYATQTVHVEIVKFLDMPVAQCPCFAAV